MKFSKQLKRVLLASGLLLTAASAYALPMVCDMYGCEERCVGDVCGMKCSEIRCHN